MGLPSALDPLARGRIAREVETRLLCELHRLARLLSNLFVGRLIEKKGLGHILTLAENQPHLKFLIVGDGPMSNQVSDGRPNIIWIQKRPHSDMPTVYAAADLFVLPSTGEGCPITVQEALACGLRAVVRQDEPFAKALQASSAIGRRRSGAGN